MNVDSLRPLATPTKERPEVLIHYNAYDFCAPAPQDDVWANYQNPDSAKMFLVCADSWRRRGWQVKRLNSEHSPEEFVFRGALLPWVDVYPLACWNVWFMLRDLAPCLYCTTDVINYGLTPKDFTPGVWNVPDGSAITFQTENHWTATLAYVTPKFCEEVISLIYAVDNRSLPLPKAQIVSDDIIIREHMPSTAFIRASLLVHNVNAAADKFKLVHYPRSGIVRGLARYDIP